MQNLLRKASWFNFDHYMAKGEQEFANDLSILHYHVGRSLFRRPLRLDCVLYSKVNRNLGHCVDVLRQQLMCTADVGVVPFIWVAKEETDEPHILPDFSTVHRCRDFDAIREWGRSHQTLKNKPKMPILEEGDMVVTAA